MLKHRSIWSSDANHSPDTSWDICWDYLSSHKCARKSCPKRHLNFDVNTSATTKTKRHSDLLPSVDEHHQHEHEHVDDAPAIHELCDAPEYVPSPSVAPTVATMTTFTSATTMTSSGSPASIDQYDYTNIIKYVLWTIINYDTCSVQRLHESTSIAINWINTILYNFYLCGILTSNADQSGYTLSGMFRCQYLQQPGHPLMAELQRKFGAFGVVKKEKELDVDVEVEDADTEDTDSRYLHSIDSEESAIEREHILVLRNIVNHQTCSIERLMHYTQLDEDSIIHAIRFWNSLGFRLDLYDEAPLFADSSSSLEHASGDVVMEKERIHHMLTRSQWWSLTANSLKMHDQTLPKRTKRCRRDQVCAICMDHRKDYICTPCGHYCLCAHCKSRIKHKCPICARKCDVIKVFK